MRDSWQEHEELKNSLSLFVLIILFIFAAELFIMDLFTPLFSRMSWLTGSLLDAVIVTLLCAAPLWFFLTRLTVRAGSLPARPRLLLLGQALSGIFLTEFLVMLLVPVLFPGANAKSLNFADAVLTSLVSAFPLWWLLFRSLRGKGAATLASTLDTPLRLFASLLAAVFLVDLLQETVFPSHTFDVSPGLNRVFDACITALLSAPFLWIFVARPLKRAARSGQTRTTALYAQVVDAIVVLTRRGMLTSCNPAAERIFGFKSAEMRGKSAALLLRDGERGLNQLLAGAEALCGEEAVLSTEVFCLCRDGSTPIMDVSLSEVLLEGRQEYLLIMRDITSRKKMEEALRESEARFRQIFEQSEDAIIFFRFGTLEILDVNSRAQKLFGYAVEELLEGGVDLICSGADCPSLQRDIAGIATGRPVRWDNMRARRRDGGEIILSLRAKVMVLHGIPVTYCSLRDITERVRMEERAHEIRTKLIQANKMTSLGLLVSGVAHEINNPNNYVTVNARLFERIWQDALAIIREYHEENGDFCLGGVGYPQLEPHSRELLAGIIDGSRRIDEIVTNLKRFARQELAAPEEVDLNGVAAGAVSLMHHELIKFTDRFEIDLAPESEPVRGSRQQLGQVVINLLMNACQALPGKDSAIRLATSLDRDAGEMTLTVSDQGCGIPPEEGRRVMEPFFSTKLDRGGTGLGLAICDSIIKEHHGTLSFVSEPGEGTTFTVRLPVGDPPRQTEQSRDGQGK